MQIFYYYSTETICDSQLTEHANSVHYINAAISCICWRLLLFVPTVPENN